MRSLGITKAFSDWLRDQGVFTPPDTTVIDRMAVTREVINVVDVMAEDASIQNTPLRIATRELGKARSFAAIPIISGDQLIGAFTVYRTRVHPFNDRALELAQAFADQAAVAIENARQIRAMEARLGQSSATREILDAISSASDDEGPVFQTILRNAAKLCFRLQ